MPWRFTVLGSGSAGNVSLLEADGFGVLIDIGLGPRQLASRLAVVGASWAKVHAVLLTHTHTDHWKERTFGHLRRLRIPVYCHADHQEALRACSLEFPILQTYNLVRAYVAGQEWSLAGSLRCRPLPLRHDGGATFGFRMEGPGDLYSKPCALAYAADLGSWTPELAHALADVDVLALEFNHDVALEHASARPAQLIARVMGDDGHLSNLQAAALLDEVLQLSRPGRLQHIVQLHLSRDCNRSELALEAARAVVARQGSAIAVHTASQFRPGPTLCVGGGANQATVPRQRTARTRQAKTRAAAPACQRLFRGWEDDV